MIPLLLAQHAPEFTSGQLYAGVGLLLTLLLVVLLWRKVFVPEPPLHKEYVSRADHTALEERLDVELGRERGARKQMHQEIATLQSGVEVVKNQNAAHSLALAELRSEQAKIRDRIDDVPQRTINLLRSSGALK